jgi:hypothetical protein
MAKSGLPKSEFEAKLTSIANVFEEWRYIFESQSAGFDNGFLQWLANFMETASEVVAEKT